MGMDNDAHQPEPDAGAVEIRPISDTEELITVPRHLEPPRGLQRRRAGKLVRSILRDASAPGDTVVKLVDAELVAGLAWSLHVVSMLPAPQSISTLDDAERWGKLHATVHRSLESTAMLVQSILARSSRSGSGAPPAALRKVQTDLASALDRIRSAADDAAAAAATPAQPDPPATTPNVA